jgi:hypothetical protein
VPLSDETASVDIYASDVLPLGQVLRLSNRPTRISVPWSEWAAPEYKSKDQLSQEAATAIGKTIADSAVALSRTKMLYGGLAGAIIVTPIFITSLVI